ncbi:MAG: P-loop NTPase [Planctomycetes bacterium]|nr:P-loop NTPase [Planctomycetota bacterium]MBZ0151379.1 P-loop NTPase [Planctomycetota bacterium]MCC7399316.1 P-loop NTPase [Planctomycetota bacterium]
MDRTAAGRQAASRGGLGPRGRGLFGRLLEGLRGAPAQKQEAVSIAIASGKGGTGKSFLATSLAVLLHRAGRRTVLVDCDFGLACDHLLLGVKPSMTLQQLLAGQCTLDQVLVTSPCGPRLLPGASGVRRMATPTDKDLLAFSRELGTLAAGEDVLLLDLGAGIAPATVLSMLGADWIVLVTQPEIAALVDAYAVVKCVAQMQQNARFLVVVNRVGTPGRGELAFQRLTEVARQHVGVELHYLGEIPDDDAVMQHRLGQLPLVASEPEAPTSVALLALVARLEQICSGLRPREVAGDAGIEARFRQHRLFL